MMGKGFNLVVGKGSGSSASIVDTSHPVKFDTIQKVQPFWLNGPHSKNPEGDYYQVTMIRHPELLGNNGLKWRDVTRADVVEYQQFLQEVPGTQRKAKTAKNSSKNLLSIAHDGTIMYDDRVELIYTPAELKQRRLAAKIVSPDSRMTVYGQRFSLAGLQCWISNECRLRQINIEMTSW